MSLAYRTVLDDDEYRPVYRCLLRYAFAPERGPDPDDEPFEQPAEVEPRGLYETAGETSDGDPHPKVDAGRPRDATDVPPTNLVVAGALVDFRMRVRGAFRPVGGVTAIASPPERRRRGHVGALLDHMHEELRGRDVAVAALWPFSHAFYARFGYGRTNDYLICEFPPDALDAPAATPETEGTFRRLSADDPDDVDALVALHERSTPEPLAVARSPDWWRLRVFRTWTTERFVYGWGDGGDGGNGGLRSYLAYRVEDEGEGRTLAVDYWGAADEEAYRHLLAFLRNHDSQVAQIRFLASDASLLDRLADPDEDVTTKVKPGPMVRVVDVEAALSGLATPASDDRVVLSVRDPRYEWNDGRFAVGVEGGLTTCRAVEAGRGEAEQAVDIDVGALSRLVVGARSATDLATLGGVDGDAESVARLDALLPVETPAPYLREWF
ncbi:GNAT family N-acetyltransferase [Salinigranum rubrum]|uniref:GNAT family N-acetyltransferase n=1 Tax=Salinigranum rubrum TaxID=755307 RepID=A0A2I8VMA1_9EURY|nr:GNAT family N-acetyltransferase [Salinigranum rubrum]AUV83048.1 GNAT family N-acetyltransferase [Salinigranum rubrum]